MGKGTILLKSEMDSEDAVYISFSETKLEEDKKHEKRFPVKNVDHSDLLLFTLPTPQTELAPEVVEKMNQLFAGDNSIEKIGEVYNWVKENFKMYRGRGKMVAKQSAQQLYDGRKLSGCNDWGLLQTAILRCLKFPVVFMNAASIKWAKEYRNNPSRPPGFSGHTFLEIHIKGRWILMDSTSGQYIEEYDFDDPVLHMHKRRGGYFVYQKGLDHWTMGIRSIEDNKEIMKDFALNYPLDTIAIQDKEIKSFVPSKK
jgi:hypothetical protein